MGQRIDASAGRIAQTRTQRGPFRRPVCSRVRSRADGRGSKVAWLEDAAGTDLEGRLREGRTAWLGLSRCAAGARTMARTRVERVHLLVGQRARAAIAVWIDRGRQPDESLERIFRYRCRT